MRWPRSRRSGPRRRPEGRASGGLNESTSGPPHGADGGDSRDPVDADETAPGMSFPQPRKFQATRSVARLLFVATLTPDGSAHPAPPDLALQKGSHRPIAERSERGQTAAA